MRHLFPILLLVVLVSARANAATQSIPPQTPTRVVCNTNDLLYPGGLGEAGVSGFCKRLETYVIENFAKRDVTVTAGPETSGAAEAKINIKILAIEPRTGAKIEPFLGAFAASKLRANYTANLESPAGQILATWKHEVDEDSADKLARHMANDIFKYLKKGYK